MAERKAAKQTRPALDEDAISIHSTESEAYSSDQEFPVECILAEKKEAHNRLYYLISWAGYPEEKSTWEPRNNIQDPAILKVWKETKNLEAEGKKQPFDLAGFKARLEELKKAKQERHRLRKIKRKRLKIPVSASGSEAEPEREQDVKDSDSAEDMEVDEDPGESSSKKTKKKLAVVPKEVPPLDQRPAESPRPLPERRSSRISLEDGEDESSSDSSDSEGLTNHPYLGDKKKATKKALQAIKDKRVQRASTNSEERGTAPSTKKIEAVKKTGRFSDSSVEAPLSAQQQRLEQRVPTPPTPQAKQRPQVRVTTKPLSANDSSISPVQTPTSADSPPTRGLPATRGGTGRGQSAKRGGAAIITNVFKQGTTRKKKPSLLQSAANATKAPKPFANMHVQWKAQKAGRELADAAPDLEAIGGLYTPGQPFNMQSVKSSTLRKSSSNAVPEDSDIQWQSVEMEVSTSRRDSVDHEISPFTINQPEFSSTSDPPRRPSGKLICYFWANNQDHYCPFGYLCRYLHEERPGCAVAPAPGSFDRPCIHWMRGYCIRGDKCPFSHPPKPSDNAGTSQNNTETARTSLPNASIEPTLFVENSDFDDSIATLDEPNSGPQPTPSIVQPESSAPAKPPVPPWRREPAAASESRQNQVGPPNSDPSLSDLQWGPSMTNHESSTSNTASNNSERPPYNPQNKYDAICHYFYTPGLHCFRGSSCLFLHTMDETLPVAPGPYKPRVPCRYYMEGYCRRGSECTFVHSSRPGESTSLAEDEQIPFVDEPERLASNINPADAQKLIVFGIGQPVSPFNQPQSSSDSLPPWTPTGPANNANSPEIDDQNHSRTTRSSTICHYWAEKGFCWNSRCKYKHYNDESHVVNPEISTTIGNTLSDQSPDQASTPNTQAPADTFQIHPQRASSDTNFSINNILVDLERDQALTPTPPLPDPPATTTKKNATKMTIGDHRRKAASKAFGARGKEVLFGSDATRSIAVDFGDFGESLQQSWGVSFSSIPTIKFDQMCTAQDFEAQHQSLERRICWRGSLSADPADRAAISELDRIWEQLRLLPGGLISVCPEFVVLLYPASEEWKFTEPSSNLATSTGLKYVIFETRENLLPDLKVVEKDKSTDYRKDLVRSLQGLSFKKLLPKAIRGQIYHFYLLFPPSADETAAFFTSWLEAAWPYTKIYSSNTEGSWNFFARSSMVDFGIILIHESAVAHVAELPSLLRLINPDSDSKGFTFWCIGDSSAPYPVFSPLRSASLGQMTVTRLFPHGQAVLLTPSFLIAHPERALQLLAWFREKLRTSTTVGTNKLVCCHNIGDYLLELACNKSLEREQFRAKHRDDPRADAMEERTGLSWKTCELRFACHSSMSEMLSVDVSDACTDFYNSGHLDEAVNPIVFADESINPDDEQALVNWFAGWSMTKLDQFRKFVVVGSTPSSKERACRMKEVLVGDDFTSVSMPDPVSKNSNDNMPENGFTRRASDNPPLSAAKSKALAVAARLAASAPTTPLSSTRTLERDPFSELKKSSPSPIHSKAPANKMMSSLSNNGESSASKGQATKKSRWLSAFSPVSPAQQSLTKPFSTHNGRAGTDMKSDVPSSKHGIDDEAPTDILHFVAMTGSDAPTAEQFLSQANDNVQQAVDLYNKAHSTDAQIEELIASETFRHLPRLAIADAQRAAEMYSSPHTAQVAPLRSAATDEYSPRLQNGSQYSPQLGPSDSRPQSSGSATSNNSIGSGAVVRENGSRFIPRSLRPNGTIRREITVKSGYVAPEDVQRYRVPGRGFDDVGADSRRGSNASFEAQNSAAAVSLASDAMDVDLAEPQHNSVGSVRNLDTFSQRHVQIPNDREMSDITHASDISNELEPSESTGETIRKEIRFEPTTEWYGCIQAEGKGWEHIYVGGWEMCWSYYLRIKK